MDNVQKFIEENKFQLGYIMQEASRRWIKKDPIGALTVGECKANVDLYGSYNELIDKVERYENALREIAEMPYGLREVMVKKAKEALQE